MPFVSHQNPGTVRDMGKILLGFCSQYISRKSHGSVPKNSKQFWCSGEKTGSGGGKLPPLATQGLRRHEAMLPMYCSVVLTIVSHIYYPISYRIADYFNDLERRFR